MHLYSRTVLALLIAPALCAVLLSAPGCEGLGAASYIFAGGEPVKKLYKLPDQRTLVMVDTVSRPGQPNVLARPDLRSIVATDIAYHIQKLEEKKDNAPLTAGFVPVQKLNKLAAESRDEYARTPIDEVARRLDAQQVIHVLIERSQVHVGGGLYRPQATAQVKVIDVENGKRLWPTSTDLSAESAGLPGHPVTVEMDHEGVDAPSQATTEALTQALAHEVGLTVSRLFYDWRKPDLGSQIH